MNAFYSFLGLINRARKCISGEELVLKAIQQKKAQLVIISEDASENTHKKIVNKCNSYKIPYIQATDRFELGRAIGKTKRVVVAVTDQNFATKLKSIFDQSIRG